MRDVLDNDNALSLLYALEDRAVEIDLDGDDLIVSPRSVLTDEDITNIRQHKAALVRLVQICDDGVQERVVSFTKQRPSTAPVFEPGFRYVAGVCFSCGDRHEDRHQWGRCWRCALALRLAWGLSIPETDQSSKEEYRAESVASSLRDHPQYPAQDISKEKPHEGLNPTK